MIQYLQIRKLMQLKYFFDDGCVGKITTKFGMDVTPFIAVEVELL